MDHADAFGQLVAGAVLVGFAVDLGIAFLMRVTQDGTGD